MKIDITGLPKEKVLMELYNNSPTMMGFEITPNGMKIDHAKRLVEESLHYDRLNGRALWINLSGDIVDFTKYDSERSYESKRYGFKAKTAKQIIESLRREIDMTEGKKDIYDGQIIEIKIDGKKYQTYIEDGQQFFVPNKLMDFVMNNMIDMSRLRHAFEQKEFSLEEYRNFHIEIGYSVTGFDTLFGLNSGLEDDKKVKIENPLWE